MNQYLIMCRSLTYAQMSSRVLERAGIISHVVRAPHELTAGGCSYAVSVKRGGEEAVNILKNKAMISGRIYKKVGEKYIEI